jgi:cell wall-associated protease
MKKLLPVLLLSTQVMAASYVVELDNKNSLKSLKSLAGVSKVEAFSPFDLEETRNQYVIEVEGKTLAEVKANNFILNAEENFDVSLYEIKPGEKTEKVTDDYLSRKQWGLKAQDQILVEKSIREGNRETVAIEGMDIKWENAIEKIESKLTKTPLVAVIDMGIDLEHPDLKDAIYKNPKECDEDGNVIISERIDRDKNKLPGDCHGWNFAAQQPYETQFPLDDVGHGTHISGIIAAKRNNGVGVAGVSDKIKILPIRVVGAVDNTKEERSKILMRAPSQRIANGIYYAALMGADVINLSLGWPRAMDTDFMRKAFEFAFKRGTTIVAAAGNDGGIADIYPCNYPGVICVGATRVDGKITGFSNYGGQVDIVAPGDNILSTIPTKLTSLNTNIQGFDYGTGTSQAAPFVSATVALLKAAYPKENAAQIRMRLFSSTKKIDNLGKSLNGLLQLEDAFNSTEKYMVRPLLKGFDTVTFKTLGAPAQFRFNIESLGAAFGELKVKASSMTKGVEVLTSEFTIPQVNKRIIGLNMAVKVTAGAPQYFKMKLTFEYEGKSEEYMHIVNIGRNIFNVAGVQATEVNTQDLKIPLIIKNNNQFVTILKQIPDLYQMTQDKAYYVEKTNKEEIELEDGRKVEKVTGRTIHLLQKNSNEVGLLGSHEIAGSRKMILLQRADFNYDGKIDYLMANIVLKEGATSGEIVYDYLDENFNVYKTLTYLANDTIYSRGVVFNPTTIRYRKDCDAVTKECIAIPLFTMVGRIPDRDQKVGAWDRYDDSIKVRTYTFHILKGGKLEIHALLNNIEEEKIQATLSNINADIATVALLHQNVDAFLNGKVEMLYTAGNGIFQKNVVGTINNKEITYNVLDKKSRLRSNRFYENVSGGKLVYTPYPHKELIDMSVAGTDRNTHNAFAEFVTEKQVKLMLWDGEKEIITNYVEKERNEKIENFIAQFKLPSGLYASFLSSSNYVIYLEGDKHYKTRIKRFSYLPGYVMQEMYAPLDLVLNGEAKAALYSNSALVSLHKVSLKFLEDEEFRTYANYNFHLPEVCVAMDPVKLGATQEYHLNLLCSKKGGKFQFINIPIR